MSIRNWMRSIQRLLTRDITQTAEPTQQEIQMSEPDEETLKRIEKKAYELYVARGRKPGYHLEDWQEAQRWVAKEKKFKK